MTIAHDSAFESHTGTTGSTSTTQFQWTHTPTGTPRGILVLTFYNSSADGNSAVTYGGVTCTPVTGGRAVDTATEPGDAKAWFLGSGVPTGSQNVVVFTTNNGFTKYGVSIALTADADTEVTGTPILLQENGSCTEQAINTGATTAQRYAAINCGLAATATTGGGSTTLHNIDLGSRGDWTVRQTTPSSGSGTVGFSMDVADDRAAVHLAIGEIAATLSLPFLLVRPRYHE